MPKNKSSIKIQCAYDKLIPVSKIKPNPENPNGHSQRQIKLLAEIIRETGIRCPVTVSNLSGLVVRGHGRLEALKELGVELIPVDFQDYDSPELETADLIADNRIAELANMNQSKLKELMKQLQETGLNMSLTGYDSKSLKEFMDHLRSGDQPYTTKINTPVYEITGENPDLADLYDDNKYLQIIKRIESSGLPEDIKNFLKLAATRHIVLDFASIAEYYAHAGKELQGLMEDQALVIIDYDKAIEAGYVELTNDILDLAEKDYPNE